MSATISVIFVIWFIVAFYHMKLNIRKFHEDFNLSIIVNMKNILILIVIETSILFSSCGTYKKLTCLEPLNVSEFSSEIFNGNYYNKAITENREYQAIGNNLWYSLCAVYSVKGSKVDASNYAIVNLQFINNRLYAQLIEGCYAYYGSGRLGY